MRRLSIALVLITACAGGFLTWALWPPPAALHIEAVSSKPTEIFDDSGVEMCEVTLNVSNRLAHEGVYLKNNDAKIEVLVGGTWIEVHGGFMPADLGTNESKQAVLFLPGNAERCRMRLHYAFRCLAWRFGDSLWRLGIKLPPRYWRWVGPKAEGQNPSWKEVQMEFPLPSTIRTIIREKPGTTGS